MSAWVLTSPASWLTEGIRARLDALGIEIEIEIGGKEPSIYGRDRTPRRSWWLAHEIDVVIACTRCGDRASIGSTTPRAPRCSCEALAVAASEIETARLARLADPRAARPGRCCIDGCRSPGVHWYRTDLTPAGTRAVRACDRHEILAERLLDRLTMADAVRLATRTERRRAREAAALADQAAQAYRRTSALLAGASSATHTYALLAGAAEREAARQRAFLAALAASAPLA